MYLKTLVPETRRVLEAIAKEPRIDDFYLAGGTALALQIGHRESIDLDFFSATDFKRDEIKTALAALGQYRLINEEEGTLDGSLDGVKLSFLRYEYPMLFPLIPFEGIHLADIRDIACMKLDAVSSRGSKKDFIDIFFLLKQFPMNELIGFFEKKYSHIQYNKLHILKSLTYFSEAEDEPFPKMLVDVSWEDVKETMRSETKKLVV